MNAVIAIVDDDQSMLDSLQDLLESVGYDVRVYSSASPLLSSELAELSLLITDVGLPVIDGFQLRERVKRARPQLPVILISGRRDLASRPQYESQTYPEFFPKPFDGKALIAAISQALYNH